MLQSDGSPGRPDAGLGPVAEAWEIGWLAEGARAAAWEGEHGL
ncbi:MAG TPA: hypothetical protein VGG77_09490 [Roseiarcus sp.]